MERIHLTSENVAEVAEKAAGVLRAGGIVLYPTDTLYGLGADALSDSAVGKIFEIKTRDEGRPVHSIVSDMQMAARYALVTGFGRILDTKLPKGKITFVMQKKEGLETGIARGLDTFGFRIPAHELCILMVRALERPITATSANVSGDAPRQTVDAILESLGEKAHGIDLIIDGGELPAREPSTVIDLTHDHPLIIREAAVSADDVRKAIGIGR
jgi:L-threonylcarbamoyladenylate synthase